MTGWARWCPGNCASYFNLTIRTNGICTICPADWNIQTSMRFWDTNGIPNIGQITRLYNNQRCVLMLNWITWNITVLIFKQCTYGEMNRLKWKFLTLKLYFCSTKLFEKEPLWHAILILNWIVWIWTLWLNWIMWNRNVFDKLCTYAKLEIVMFICTKIDLALNNSQRLTWYKIQTSNK